MSRAEAARAELRVLELEEQLSGTKAEVERCGECGRRLPLPTVEGLRDLKYELREARRVLRTLRAGGDLAAGEARPGPVTASAAVGEE